MRIAFIVGHFPILSETFILNQITGLIDRGHEIDIYAVDGPIKNLSKVHPDVEKYGLLDRTYCIPQFPGQIPKRRSLRVLRAIKLLFVNWYKNPLLLLRSLNFFKHGKLAYSLKLLYKVIPFVDKKQYDIIHCQFGTYALQGMFFRNIGALKGSTLISSFRGYDISWYIQQYGEQVYNELFSLGDFFLPNCKYFKRRLLNLGCDEKKVVVHGSGIDCSRFIFKPRYLNSDGTVQITTIGRLVEKKGIEYSIRAVAKLIKVSPNIEYKIIGDGELREKLQQLIQELDVSHKVKLLGGKQQREIVEILNKSHIFIATSVTAKDGNQDAPVNTLKEAMAMGLPVIGTQHGGIPELVEDGISGFLVPERNVDAIAEKLSYLIKHPEIWPRMGQAGRAYVEKHYDTNKLNDQLVEIYQRLLINNADEEYQVLEQDIPVGAGRT